ncbi:MAG: retropepsin-like aspartic protease [Bacteroidota bacterium]
MKRKRKIIIPLRIRKIEKIGYHIFIKAKMNGHSVNMLVDTGASKTVFDKVRGEELMNEDSLTVNPEVTMGIGADSMESHIAVVDSLKLGKLEILKLKTVFLDLSHVNRAFEMIGIRQVDGIIGGDILRKYEATIDYKTAGLTLRY